MDGLDEEIFPGAEPQVDHVEPGAAPAGNLLLDVPVAEDLEGDLLDLEDEPEPGNAEPLEV